MEKLDLYELVIDENTDDEVFALSLVSEPAIQSNFIYLNKNGKQLEVKFASIDEEKRLIVGPILIPDMKILRQDSSNEKPYEVFFSKDTVKQAAQKYLADNNANNITVEHERPVDGVSLVESWIVDSTVYDKSKMYGLNAKIGTWMGVFKVNNLQVWEQVKAGDYKGISLEGIFSHLKTNLSAVKDKSILEMSDVEAEELLAKLKVLLADTYADYGEGISNNAKRGIELNEKNNNKCATQTGKVRAQQLANGEAISVDTIQRMYSYLSRAETYYDENDMNACGTISYLLWGGKSALSWSRNKLRELGLIEAEAQPSVNSSYGGEVASGSISPALLD
jgi:hypothetical protein